MPTIEAEELISIADRSWSEAMPVTDFETSENPSPHSGASQRDMTDRFLGAGGRSRQNYRLRLGCGVASPNSSDLALPSAH